MHINRILTCLVTFVCMITAYGQDQFTIKEVGLRPELIVSKIDQVTSNELYTNALNWIKANEEKYELTVDQQTENESIELSLTKSNAVNLADRYFHAKYLIKISFENGQYNFQPMEILLKVNSKYDMGWKEFDLADGTQYHKKGKVIKKYKAYLQDLVTPLNEFYTELDTHLKVN